MRIFCTSRISWNRISDWLPIVFHFGTENWEEQLKKAPCTLRYVFLPFQELISYAANRGHHPEIGPLGGEFNVAQCLPEVWEREKKWEI